MVFKSGHISDSSELGNWYFNSSEMIYAVQNQTYGPLDADGLPLVDYDKWNRWGIKKFSRKKIGIHYTPVTIAHYGFALLWQYYLSGQTSDRLMFLRCADWFVANQVQRQGGIVWLHDWYEHSYKLRRPWISAMAQGEGIGVLLRAYQLTGDKKYSECAEAALRIFDVSVADGGIKIKDNSEMIWFEEYPSSPPSRVLNGYIYGLLGIFDYYRLTKSRYSKTLWDKGVQSLEHYIAKYDTGFWSRYDLYPGLIANHYYHPLHILQLEIVSKLSLSPHLEKYASQWAQYQRQRRFHYYQYVSALLFYYGIRPLRPFRES